jgi:hypothetical protein
VNSELDAVSIVYPSTMYPESSSTFMFPTTSSFSVGEVEPIPTFPAYPVGDTHSAFDKDANPDTSKLEDTDTSAPKDR